MNDDIIIRTEGLGKKYVIGHQAERERYVTFRDVMAGAAKSVLQKVANVARGRRTAQDNSTEEFWALRGVNFEVKRGEVIGIIGRNGAGKSTLLKILSRITEPTEGRVTLRGRVASLLEVGTGFHQELTGRENIFLNGAILGMAQSEIRRKFDEIVAFAEVEKFLDTPVKRYSSGMYVRLAFAVAAHLEPEILIVDEVLAVGDAEFQKRCLNKMGEVASGGRTVLFVSHNMNAIERLCQRLAYFEHGCLVGEYANVREGIARYLGHQTDGTCESVWKGYSREMENSYFLPSEFRVESAQPEAANGGPFSNKFDIVVTASGQIRQTDPALNIGVAVYTGDHQLLFWSASTDTEERDWPRLSVGPVTLRTTIPSRLLNEGKYHIHLFSSLHHRAWILEPMRNAPVISFSIQGGLSDSSFWDHRRPGLLGPVLRWDSI